MNDLQKCNSADLVKRVVNFLKDDDVTIYIEDLNLVAYNDLIKITVNKFLLNVVWVQVEIKTFFSLPKWFFFKRQVYYTNTFKIHSEDGNLNELCKFYNKAKSAEMKEKVEIEQNKKDSKLCYAINALEKFK